MTNYYYYFNKLLPMNFQLDI